MSFDKEEIENLINLLMSTDESNAKLAFEIMNNKEFPVNSLLSEIFAFLKTTGDKSLKNKAKSLLEKHGSKELIEVMKMRLPLNSGKSSVAATEKTIKKNIIQYTHNNELDGILIAKALYKKSGLGVTYLLTATPEEQRKEILKTFINGTHFKLNNKALTQIPPELFDFPELTSIDLSHNKITSIPKEIQVFKNLNTLNLSHNKLKSIHKNFLALNKLINLNISYNQFFRKFPEIIFEIPQLKKLNIIQVCGNSCWYDELPKGILQLKNIEIFESEISNRPAYPNYPSIKKVTGSPIDMRPLEIAYSAYKQGDNNPIYYILKHGTETQILNILHQYYDATTQTMNLDSIHVEQLPQELKQFKIKKLSMRDCGLGTYYGNYSYNTEVIDRIKRRSLSRTAILNELTDLETLDLSKNHLCEIADLSKLKKLKTLNLSENKFRNFPLNLTTLRNLETLYMSHNYPTLSDRITLNDFPTELQQLTSLTLFQVSIQGMMNQQQYFMERIEKLLPHCKIIIG